MPAPRDRCSPKSASPASADPQKEEPADRLPAPLRKSRLDSAADELQRVLVVELHDLGAVIEHHEGAQAAVGIVVDVDGVDALVAQLRLEVAGIEAVGVGGKRRSLDEEGWRDKKHPFTFTALTDDPNLEFTIKSYFNTGGDGVTERLYGYTPGRSLILRDVWGTITYKGPGTFIAGGAGVTPFIAILRDLHHNRKLEGHTLVASNRTEADIILRDEFESFRGLETIWTVTDDPQSSLLHERVDAAFLNRHVGKFDRNFYLCGPDDMVKDLRATLKDLGANVENVTWEK